MSSTSGSVRSEPPAVQAPQFSLRQKILLWLITRAAYMAIAFIGPTLRYSISWEEEPSASGALYEKSVIYSFWHRAVFAAAYMWRNTGIAVMVSRSFDGEYIARTIEMLGFSAVRGSSSRGGAGALLGLRKFLDTGFPAAFTIDGPRGPKYVAKPGPVLLARETGLPMAAFYVALSHAWVLTTWDEMMIPKPFAKALVRASVNMFVPKEASDAEMADHQAKLQKALERVTRFAEENVGQVGSAKFPIVKR